MNLRISSLDSDSPRAGKDCKVCNRRRIRCDRSLPTCRKCGIRNLDCPGYELKLKWDQGVASRGKFAGRAVPKPQDGVASHRHLGNHLQQKFTSSQTRELTRGPCMDSQSSKVESTSLIKSSPGRGSSHTTTGAIANYDMEVPFNDQYGIDLSLSWSNLPGTFQQPHVRRLIHHYDQFIATTLVWVDSTDNPWRNKVLPLALESPSLLFAILALAGEHLSTKMSSKALGSPPNGLNPSAYRDKSLELLAMQLCSEARGLKLSSGVASMVSAKSILATMLILCNLEMVHSDSAVWHVHLEASRTMIRRWLSASPSIVLSDDTSKFLVEQFFVIDVFASTSRFGGNEDIPRRKPTEGECTIFSEYLEVIHDVTISQRRRTFRLDLCDSSILALHERFNHARSRTRSFSHRFGLVTQRIRIDFDRVVEIYHSAGLIYTYQALVEPGISARHISKLLNDLIRDLKLMPTTGLFAQNLAWPLFIAGTASRGNIQEQQIVEKITLETMQSTGFSNCQQALRFLRVFWSADSSAASNWIDFAEGYAKSGHVFLVL